MKRSVFLALMLICTASVAFAQPPGSIGLFSDPGGTNCDVNDIVPGLVIIYVVHVYTPGATAAQFRVVCGWGANMIYLSDVVTPPYFSIGSSQTGIVIAYGVCATSPNMILALNFFGQGLSAPCSYCQVMDDPTASPPGIYVWDCSDPPQVLNATGGDVVINPVAGCFCDVPVEGTTWGGVKALYQ